MRIPLLTPQVERIAARRIAAGTNGRRRRIPDRVNMPGLFDAAHLYPAGQTRPTLAYARAEPKPAYVISHEQPRPPEDIMRELGLDFEADAWQQGSFEFAEHYHHTVIWPQPRSEFLEQVRFKAPAAGTVICFQGDGGSFCSDASLLPIQAMLVNAGYRVISVDLRGQGMSTGRTRGWGVLDGQDVASLLNHLEQKERLAGTVGVLGLSYGAGVAIHAAAADPRVRAVLSIAPWGSMRRWLKAQLALVAQDDHRRLWRWSGWMCDDGFIDAAIDRAGALLGIDPDEADQALAITRTQAAVMLVHGDEDKNCHVQESRRIHAARPDGTQLVVYEGEDHASVLYRRWEDLRERCLNFFKQHLTSRDAAVAHDPAKDTSINRS